MNLLDLLIIYASDPTALTLSIGSVLAALFVLLASRNRNLGVATKVFLIYLHIALLIVPLALFAYSSGCAMPAAACTTKTLLFALPFLLAGIITAAGLLGYFLLPRLYRKRFGVIGTDARLSAFAATESARQGIRAPQVHVVDGAAPVAFSFSSFRPAIFLSVGLLELLSRRETEAVVLHELGHLARHSTLLTFSARLAKAVSPLAMFTRLHDDEECAADAFAAGAQGTSRFVETARAKVQSYFSFSE